MDNPQLCLCAADDNACADYPRISSSEVTNALGARANGLRFTANLERMFEIDNGTLHARSLISRGLPALVLFSLFLGFDYIAVPDVFWLAVVLRLGFIVIAGVATAWAMAGRPTSAVREGLMAGGAVAAAGILLVLMAASHSAHRDIYHYAMLPILMFAAMVLRVRFQYVLASSVAIVFLHLAAVLISGMDLVNQVGAVAMMISAGALSLFAGYLLERETRTTWLLSLRERLRSDRFEEMSTVDPLTGLGNRRALDRALAELRDGASGDGVLAIAIADIDYFKAYNDAYGHLAGDDCLRRVAGLLTREANRNGGTVYRFGGEEFVVLLPATDTDAAAQGCERLRHVVENAGIVQKMQRQDSRLTVSIGVTVARMKDGLDPDVLIFEADTALYEAKKLGRNQVSGALPSRGPELRQTV